jgi:fluoroacetyl-CoA thioesterase
MGLETGLTGSASLEVTDSDTAIAMRSGDVPTLGTPRLIALCEEATLRALNGHVQPGCSSVGVRVQVEHISPTAIGRTVVAEATLEKIEGRRLVFSVSAKDDHGLVAAGKVTRVMVELERFLEKAR